MDNSKLLPVNSNVNFLVECYHQCRLSILLAIDDYLPWYYSHFATLKYQSQPEGEYPLLTFEDHLNIYAQVLSEEPISRKGDIVISVISALDGGEYALIYLNWSDISSSHYYGKEDIIHEALIYGYDNYSQVFHLLSFQAGGGSFRAITLTYEEVRQGFFKVCELHSEQNRWFAYYGFPVVRIRPRKPRQRYIDRRLIYFQVTHSRIRASSVSNEAFASGYYVNLALHDYYQSLVEERQKISDSQHPIWAIMNNKQLKHCQLMIERCVWMQQERQDQDKLLERIVSSYRRMEVRIKVLIGQAAKWMESRDAQLLRRIGEEHYRLYELERRAIPMLLEYLVRLQLSDPIMVGDIQSTERSSYHDERSGTAYH